MIDWGNIIESALIILIQALIPALIGFVIVWLREKIGNERYEYARALVSDFVAAAQQSGLMGELENAGEVKKAWVIERVQAALRERGINIDIQKLSDIIEAEVYNAITSQQIILLPPDGEDGPA